MKVVNNFFVIKVSETELGQPMYACVAASVKNEPVFKQFQVLRMRKNMRADQNEKEFSDWLCDVGSGKINIKGTNELEIPSENVAKSSDELLDFCFQDLFNAKDPLARSNILADAAILAPTNDNVNTINNKALEKLNGNKIPFYSIDTPLNMDYDYRSIYGSDNNIENIHAATPSGLPPHLLELKVKMIY